MFRTGEGAALVKYICWTSMDAGSRPISFPTHFHKRLESVQAKEIGPRGLASFSGSAHSTMSSEPVIGGGLKRE